MSMETEDGDNGNGLDLSVGDAVTGEGDEGSRSRSSSSSGGSDSERGHVHIKGSFGTKTFQPDTECRFCEDKAEGVMVFKKKTGGDGNPIKAFRPLCEEHREEMEQENEINFREWEYERF